MPTINNNANSNMPPEVLALIKKLQEEVEEFGKDLAALRGSAGASQPGLPPCQKQQPFDYSVEIPLVQGAASRTPGTFTVSQDGPFVALAIQAAWRETGGTYAGRWMPPSSEELWLRSVANFNFASPPRPDTIDFEYEISDGNSDRNWQDKPVPSSFLYSVGGQPAFLPVPGVFAPNSTVTVAVTPTRPVTAAGLLKLTFRGYKALGGQS